VKAIFKQKRVFPLGKSSAGQPGPLGRKRKSLDCRKFLVSLVFHHQPHLLHLYLTARYLYVPKHGSPNTELFALRTHEAFPWQYFRTMANDFVALHLVVRIGPPLHVRLFERPYLACTIFIFWPALHANLAALPSQIVNELRL